jgi:chitin disaccharide deacetylase
MSESQLYVSPGAPDFVFSLTKLQSQTVVKFMTRVDKAGLCEGVNLATPDSCRRGIVRNVDILAVGPAVAHALGVLTPLSGIALGLHAGLACEWVNQPCVPVSAPQHIPSLKNKNFQFLPSIEHVAYNVLVDEIQLEIRA